MTWDGIYDGLADAYGHLADTIGNYVFLIMLLAVLPLVALARWRGTYPHTPLVIMLTGMVLVSGGYAIPAYLESATFGLLTPHNLNLIVCLGDFVILLVAFVDLFTLPRRDDFSAERKVSRIASLQQNHPVSVTLNNHSASSWHLWIRDDVPQEFEASRDEFVYHLRGRSRVTSSYDLKASRRGAYALSGVHLRVRSRLGMWKRYFSYPVRSMINVYPDMKQLAEYELLARTNRLSLMGVRRTRRIGQDNEFERLRDYTLDDNYKHIEWRATARRGKLTVKDFQTNQSQRIVFLVDCGRMMTNVSSGLSLLDHSLNAMLMLSYIALRKGDAVGLVAFSDEIHSYIPPKGGMNQMNQLLHACFDRFPKLVESRYDEAFLHLATYCKRRSLVVLLTNLIDEVNANQVEQYLANLVGQHLPLGVLMRDHEIFRDVEQVGPRGSGLYSAAAAATILSWRHEVLVDLQHKGVRSLDVFPEEMTAPLINAYLEIKARHLL